MFSLLFWNTDGRRVEGVLGNLVKAHGIELLVLAECRMPEHELLPVLARTSGVTFVRAYTNLKDTIVYVPAAWRPPTPIDEDESLRMSIRTLYCPSGMDVLLVAMHLRSKLHMKPESQWFSLHGIARRIAEAESRVGHSRTILVGDLNMDPFEPGMVAAECLHAISARSIASRGSRKVAGEEYRFFYNPMWARFGDRPDGTPGTYYYGSSESVAYFWHVFDQVLLRPDLLPYFRNEDLLVPTSDGTTSLLTERGRPDRSVASDHLPVIIRLDL